MMTKHLLQGSPVDAPPFSQAARITLAFLVGALAHISRIFGGMVRPRCMPGKVEDPPKKYMHIYKMV